MAADVVFDLIAIVLLDHCWIALHIATWFYQLQLEAHQLSDMEGWPFADHCS